MLGPRRRRRLTTGLTLLVGAAASSGACASTGHEAGGGAPGSFLSGTGEGKTPRPESCPERDRAKEPLPGVEARHRTLEYWLGRVAATHGDPDEVLLDRRALEDHDRALATPHEDGRPLGTVDLAAPLDRKLVTTELRERLDFLHERLATAQYVDEDGERLSDEDLSPLGRTDPPPLRPELRVVLDSTPLRCGPLEVGFYTPSLDLDFDRNNCSTIRPQETVQLLAKWSNGMWLARTRYAMGWLPSGAKLSKPAPEELRETLARGRTVRATKELSLGLATVPAATLLALAPDHGDRVLYADEDGIHVSEPQGGALRPTARPLTRRAVLEEAFALLDSPYGWGGKDGGRDCSRFLLDVFATFGLHLPRHSGRQALTGTFSIDLSDVPSETDRVLLIEESARKGIVLLHFPGHIMLYLGRTEDGRPMAIHAFAEYVTPCKDTKGPDGKPLETLTRVDRVTVSDLELGRRSSRTSFLERITRVVVFGKTPGITLGGAATMRPSAPPVMKEGERCDDSTDVAIFHSPATPRPGEPLRVIVTSERDVRPAALTVIAPDGKGVDAPVHQLGGPPYTFVAQLAHPEAGRYRAILADGTRIEACEGFLVRRGAPPAEPRLAEAPAWESRWRWERDTENLYSAFVEQLFTEPVDDDITWQRLQALLADPAKNLLYDHLGAGEDDKLALEPDCADLPYFLRAYFAWKTRLPFGFRRCSRGRAGRPPSCGEELHTNQTPVTARDDVEAFSQFLRLVGSGVHSASARTHPRSDQTDLYPVPLTREALRPGTVFADPYGHLLVVAVWRPQGKGSYGVLVGADAQPDGTVGRRRFWRGSFLFTPDTTDVGAGFKAWRPLTYDPKEAVVTALDNDTLAKTKEHVPYGEDQYEGTEQAFYERMEALINPRALDSIAVQVSLVDALEESVARRVNSVNNGVAFMNGRGWAPISMPEGHDIFETSGPWEDFSTPSRDMRLLISMDAVMGFPGVVARNPDRFGVTAGEKLEETVAKLRARLAEELKKRTFEYTRSDGSSFELTLSDVVSRAKTFEMAYHPNDCPEIRWAASEGSEEMRTCNHHAPAAHRALMKRYRPWFENRKRPPR